MTATIQKLFWPVLSGAPGRATAGPRQEPRRAPVFIHDAVTPWRGETLLLSILRAQAKADEDQS
jgi:hypothetical protein